MPSVGAVLTARPVHVRCEPRWRACALLLASPFLVHHHAAPVAMNLANRYLLTVAVRRSLRKLEKEMSVLTAGGVSWRFAFAEYETCRSKVYHGLRPYGITWTSGQALDLAHTCC